MFCKNCGSQINDNATFCPNCGWKNTLNEEENKLNGVSNIISKKYFWIAGIVASILAIVLFVFVIPNSKNDDIGNTQSKITIKNNLSNGWQGDYYYKNGKKLKNSWVDEYYVGKDGKYVKNAWAKYENDWYYCGNDGKIVKNAWVDNQNYYVDGSGKMLKNTTTPDGYYVGEDGKYIVKNTLDNKYSELKYLYEYTKLHPEVTYTASFEIKNSPKVDGFYNIRELSYDEEGNIMCSMSPIEGDWIYRIYYKDGNMYTYSSTGYTDAFVKNEYFLQINNSAKQKISENEYKKIKAKLQSLCNTNNINNSNTGYKNNKEVKVSKFIYDKYNTLKNEFSRGEIKIDSDGNLWQSRYSAGSEFYTGILTIYYSNGEIVEYEVAGYHDDNNAKISKNGIKCSEQEFNTIKEQFNNIVDCSKYIVY